LDFPLSLPECRQACLARQTLALEAFHIRTWLRLGLLRPFLLFLLRPNQIHRHLIPGTAFERATRPFLLPAPMPQAQVQAAPLLEEKRDFDPQALISNLHHPFLHDQYQTRRRESDILEPNFAI